MGEEGVSASLLSEGVRTTVGLTGGARWPEQRMVQFVVR